MVPPTRRANVQTLLSLRIIWLALLIGPLSFLIFVVIGVVPGPLHGGTHGGPPNGAPQPMLNWICAVMLITELPIVFVIRAVIFRRGRVNGRLPLGRYTTGNIIFWAGCEGIAFFGIVIIMLNKQWMPTLALIVIPVSLQALTFPIGTNVLLPGDEIA